jgi:ribonuclease E
MAKKMLINALHPEEARVAIVEDGRLVDLDVEIAGNEQIRGNIYRGLVVRVEPGLQAAFVDIGLKKLGFLQMGEIHPENWKWREDIPEDQRHRRPRIQEILRRGQELTVQVEKGERDNKGSALTTYVSLPGRYMVLMPGSDSAGISRKVEAEGERKKLKEIISEMSIPEGYGYIIRTEAVGRTRDELQKDLDSLVSLYEGVKAQGAAMKSAGAIYQESALIIRTIRDYFSADIDEVLVDSKDVYKDVRECLKDIDPQFEKLVKMHQEKRPIFSRYQLEEQIDLIYEKKVPLKSGGSIFIEPTEALVSIDVNSGKSTGEKGVEDTAFKTNLEAAEEAARQLRLRDLGGLIVIDFIDMRDRKHNSEVEKTLKAALKADKARVNVSRISEFGLLEMSRQRIRQTLNQASTLECPHCDGRGKVKSVEAMALSFLRKVHASAAKGTIAEVVGSLPLEVAYYLLNRKRHELSQIENDYDIQVTVKGKPSYLLNQMELEIVKREKLPQEELPQEKPAAPRPSFKEEAQEAHQEGRKKRKRGKGKGEVEAQVAAPELRAAAEQSVFEAAPAEPLEPGAVAVALVVEPDGAERVLTEAEHEDQKKKRRRRRKRGKGGSAEAAAAAAEPADGGLAEVAIDLPSGEEAEVSGEAAPAPEPLAAEPGGETAGEELKKKRRRKRRRGKPAHEGAGPEAGSEGVAATSMEAGEAASTVVEAEAAAPSAEAAGREAEALLREPAVPAAPSATIPAESVPAIAPEAAAEVPAAEKLKKPRRGRGKKAADEALAAEPTEAPAPAEEAEQPKPRKGRAPRGKRGEAPAPAAAVAPEAAPADLEIAGGETLAAPVAAASLQAELAATAVAGTEPAAKVQRKPRGRKPKGSADEAPAAAPAAEAAPEQTPAPERKRPGRKPKQQEPAGEAPESSGAEKPKRVRAPRKKKEETPS